ncbi:MAG TPA: HEAT repeat domain-containing protein [Ignavibacteria bacterium]|nr:HEAT repeat domain-containing protein [Ignavibacteria bacterium]
MIKFYIQLLLLLSFSDISFSQQNIDSILNFTLSFRGLTQQDITIPINFDKDKSPTNDSKLLLPVVRDIMKDPMRSFGFLDSVNLIKDLDLILILERLYKLRNVESTFINKIVINDNVSPEQILSFVKERNNFRQKLIADISKPDRDFLNKNLFSIIAETEDDNGANSDIFKFNKARDSSIAVSKKTMEVLSRLISNNELNYGIHDAEYCCLLYTALKESKIKFSDSEFENNNHINGDFYYYYDQNGIRIAIGGKGKNIYTGHFDFIIDLGGDDVYNIERETNDLFKNNFSCIIDLSGNDLYTTNSNYSLAGSVFSSGFIFDKEGDDIYKGKNVSLGSAICGLGVLYDENGNDTYQANQFSIGAASFGVGLLVDRNGNDVYVANSYSQGFGMTEGVGAIVDNKGNDNYLIDARSLDIGRYEDHYVSMSQGYGLGLRPYYAGGIGLIIEGEGNDFYSTDIFGQGGAYWYALGCIVDKSGHDKYNSYQYAQGAGIHLAVGLLKDYDGWDFYTSDGVSQGCGHDFGFGLLYDVKGNDNYSAYSLSQGAGNANGIGMLIDESGRDGYLNKEPGNSRGYGNSRREFGSLGIFLDASGEDFYSVGGMDSVINNSSMWGVMTDYYLQDLKSQASGNRFKIPLDSNRNYTQEEYFIMAKTIEPRFSQWQEYGFRKLVEDSLNTPEYVTRYLDTDDHRAGLVLRNLSQRLYYTMGNFFAGELKEHFLSMRSKFVLNPNEVAFICYLFGETRNPAGKVELLELTSDPNVRIRSAAVNALGKIKTDTSDTDFIDRTSKRLSELAAEDSPYKLYKKDIAYAFKNYKFFPNIASLIKLLSSDYFGVRFLASDALKPYGDEYYNFIDDQLIKEISGDRISYYSFLNSTENFSEEKFKDIYNRCTALNVESDIITDMYFSDLLINKRRLSQDISFNQWLEDRISDLQSKSILKIK